MSQISSSQLLTQAISELKKERISAKYLSDLRQPVSSSDYSTRFEFPPDRYIMLPTLTGVGVFETTQGANTDRAIYPALSGCLSIIDRIVVDNEGVTLCELRDVSLLGAMLLMDAGRDRQDGTHVSASEFSRNVNAPLTKSSATFTVNEVSPPVGHQQTAIAYGNLIGGNAVSNLSKGTIPLGMLLPFFLAADPDTGLPTNTRTDVFRRLAVTVYWKQNLSYLSFPGANSGSVFTIQQPLLCFDYLQPFDPKMVMKQNKFMWYDYIYDFRSSDSIASIGDISTIPTFDSNGMSNQWVSNFYMLAAPLPSQDTVANSLLKRGRSYAMSEELMQMVVNGTPLLSPSGLTNSTRVLGYPKELMMDSFVGPSLTYKPNHVSDVDIFNPYAGLPDGFVLSGDLSKQDQFTAQMCYAKIPYGAVVNGPIQISYQRKGLGYVGMNPFFLYFVAKYRRVASYDPATRLLM